MVVIGKDDIICVIPNEFVKIDCHMINTVESEWKKKKPHQSRDT